MFRLGMLDNKGFSINTFEVDNLTLSSVNSHRFILKGYIITKLRLNIRRQCQRVLIIMLC